MRRTLSKISQGAGQSSGKITEALDFRHWFLIVNVCGLFSDWCSMMFKPQDVSSDQRRQQEDGYDHGDDNCRGGNLPLFGTPYGRLAKRLIQHTCRPDTPTCG